MVTMESHEQRNKRNVAIIFRGGPLILSNAEKKSPFDMFRGGK